MNYGCHNRKPLRSHLTVQDGWRYVAGFDTHAPGVMQTTRVPILRRAEVPMTKTCQHTLDAPKDPKCAGCRWQD